MSTVMGIVTRMLDGWENPGRGHGIISGRGPQLSSNLIVDCMGNRGVAGLGPFAGSLEIPLRPLRTSWPLALWPVCWV